MFGEKAVVNETWLKEMSEKFKLPNLTELKSADLFNKDNTNIQQYFFYDDRKDKLWDGHNSFKSLLSFYGAKVDWDKEGNIIPIKKTLSADWWVQDKGSYVLITSVGKPKKIEIYANKPTNPDDGPEEIEKVFKDKNIQTIMVIHRGHSYHAHETIKRIPSIAKIVSLGSCGGYNNVEGVLKKAPNAHILTTKGTGTMTINDPLMKMLNVDIASGRNLNWPEFWKRAEGSLGKNKDFASYVPPHKNLGVMFLKTYRQELEKE